MPGLFLALEGVDGSGKDTQLDMLMSALTLRYPGKDIIRLKAPYDCGISGILRCLVLGQNVARVNVVTEKRSNVTEMRYVITQPSTAGILPDPLVARWLFFVEYLNTYKTLIEPALAQNKIILCNRSTLLSNYAYGVADGIPKSDMAALIVAQNAYIRKPDHVVVLDISPDCAVERIKKRAAQAGEITHYDTVSKDEFAARAAAYQELASSIYPGFVSIINAEDDAITVHQRVMSKLLPNLEVYDHVGNH